MSDQEKAPAAGVEIIDLATRRRTILAGGGEMVGMAGTFTKISRALFELYFDKWLESPEGQAALEEILAEALKSPEGGA